MKIDVLLPVRDARETLGEAIESIRSQTLAEFRCFILDDGSTDDSPAIAEEAARRDRRFVVVHGNGLGLVATLNEGLARATAPFVARADADDVNASRRFELQLAELESHPGITVVGTRVGFFRDARDPGSISADLAHYEQWLNESLSHEEITRGIFVEAPLAHPSVLMRTAAVLALGGYREGDFPEDYDLWLRGWRAGWRFAKIPEILVRLRDHAARLTRTSARYRPGAFLGLKVEHLIAAQGLAGKDVVVWGGGRDGVRAARALKRGGVRVRFVVDVAATKIGRRLVGTDVRSPESLDTRPGCLVVVAVGVKGARAKIREHLEARGYREVDAPGSGDFVCFG